MATQITTHVVDALDRLLEQYKGKASIESIITVLGERSQGLEDVTFSLLEGQEIYSAVGVQLDLLGTIVDIARNGLGDDGYRLLILGKIGENSSDGTASKVAQVFAILMNSNLVQEQDLFPAGVGLSGAGEVDDSLLTLVWNLIQASLGAGIRLEFLSCFDEDEAFAFDGPAGTGLGFDDLTDPGLGGMFASLCDAEFSFAFASDDPMDGFKGFGDVYDPVAGGNFESL